MNERIKRLCEQSEEYANESTKDFTGNEPVGWMDYYTEKFAELIVQECISQIAIIGISNDENEDILWAVDLAILNIKDRFDLK